MSLDSWRGLNSSVVRGALDHIHRKFVSGDRRAAVTGALARLLRGTSARTVLDLGCGDGQIGVALAAAAGARLTSMDIIRSPTALCAVELYDGVGIPHARDSFDVCLLADVLHHTASPRNLLKEALRVAPHVLLKDHMSFGRRSDWVLTMMDLVGNPLHSARAQYLSPAGWLTVLEGVGATQELVWPLRVHAPVVSLFTGAEHQFAALLTRHQA